MAGLDTSSVREEIQRVKEEARTAVAKIEEASQQKIDELEAGIESKVIASRVAEPELRGNADAILLHHFGLDGAKDEIAHVVGLLGESIANASPEGGFVPVLLNYTVPVRDAFDYEEVARFTMIFVPADDTATPFLSSIENKKALMHAFTEKEANVEWKRLSLVGNSFEASGELAEKQLQVNSLKGKFDIHVTATAENNQGRGYPGTYVFSDHACSEDAIIGSDDRRQGRAFSNHVGWDGLSDFVSDYPHSLKEQVVRNIYSIVRSAGVTDLEPSKGPLFRAFKELENEMSSKDKVASVVDDL